MNETMDGPNAASARSGVTIDFAGRLRSESDLKSAVSEVYRAARSGRLVRAIVTAFDRDGAAAARDAATYGAPPTSGAARALARLAAARAGALLALSAERAGLAAAAGPIDRPIAGAMGEPHDAARAAVVVSADGQVTHVDGRFDAQEVAAPAAPRRPLAVALAGLGVVGDGVAQRLCADPERYELTSVLIGDPSKPRGRHINPATLTGDLDRFLEHPGGRRPNVVVDALSCGETGAELTRRAAAAGVAVVSANKQAIAPLIEDLHAGRQGAHVGYAASVGGGAPMVETVRRAREEGQIVRIDAILNGTVNFILTALEAGGAFEEALTAAQAAGFAEADPSADLSGADAEAKVKILAFNAFGRVLSDHELTIDALTPQTADAFAAEGRPRRQIASLERRGDGSIDATVRYVALDDAGARALGAADAAFFADVREECNALVATLADGRRFTCRGRGAGRIPTVESVLADLYDVGEACAW